MLHRDEERLMLMPFGELMDQIACYRRFYGLDGGSAEKPSALAGIDDAIPENLL